MVIISTIFITIIGLLSLNVDYIPLIRYSVVDYIKRYHPETTGFLTHLVWEGGKTNTGGLTNIERYIYTSNDWTMEIVYSVIPTPEYRIKANYSSTWSVANGVPKIIVWEGIYKNERILEKSFVLIS